MSWSVIATGGVAVVAGLMLIRVTLTRTRSTRDSGSRVSEGSFFVEVHDRIGEADLSVHAQALFGPHTPTFRLSVKPDTTSSGQMKWRGQDHWGQWHDLHALSAPAVLIIREDTLPLLRHSALWDRVQDVENV